jgi:hypothetical protein
MAEALRSTVSATLRKISPLRADGRRPSGRNDVAGKNCLDQWIPEENALLQATDWGGRGGRGITIPTVKTNTVIPMGIEDTAPIGIEDTVPSGSR